MNKEEAVKFMVGKIEDIEKERLASNMAVDATKYKKETVESILKALKEVHYDK